LAALAGTASAVDFPEAEPNDTKALANSVALTATGDRITGNSTGTSTTTAGQTSADYFRVTTPLQPVGIYRNRLTITTPANHTGTIRGLGQTATGPNSIGPGLPSATALDNTAQTSSSTTTPPRFNQWYSFGPVGSYFYRVTGTTATTVDYASDWSQEAVTPTNLGTFAPGSYEFTNTGISSTQDTEVFIYDATTGTPVAGALNDDFLDGSVTQTGGSSLNSRLVRNLLPGTYWIAISNFNTADNQLSPADEGTATGTYLDFPGVLTNSSTTVLTSIPFRMVHPDGTLDFTAVKSGAFDIWFGQITIVPEPAAIGLLGLAAPALLRRRRA
jgi:hypothetical protein